MQHPTPTWSIILPSTIKIFLSVVKLCFGNQNEENYGSGAISREQGHAELSFLYGSLYIDLFYNPTKYHSNISMVGELCSENHLLKNMDQGTELENKD